MEWVCLDGSVIGSVIWLQPGSEECRFRECYLTQSAMLALDRSATPSTPEAGKREPPRPGVLQPLLQRSQDPSAESRRASTRSFVLSPRSQHMNIQFARISWMNLMTEIISSLFDVRGNEVDLP
jgi:hypothetical protein